MRINSLKSMIILTVTAIVSFSLILITLFLAFRTESYLSESIEASAINLLEATKNSVEAQYNSIQYHKEFALNQKKMELKNTMSVVFALLNKIYQDHLRGKISRWAAQQWVINLLKKTRYSNGIGYFWINNTYRPYPRMVVHPTIPELNGTILNNPKFNCALGKKENLFKAFVDVCLKNGKGYVDYFWPKPSPDGLTKQQPKLSYVQLFKPWKWIIGTGLYIDDIQKDVQRRITAVIKDLNTIILKQRIGKKGYFFIFNSDNHILVHPTLAGTDGNNLKNSETGNKLFDDFKKVISTAKSSMEYIWDHPENKGEYRFRKKVFLTYFKPLDWYIGASYYLDDHTKKITSLILGIASFSVIFLILAIIASLFISERIINPVIRLIHTIEKTDDEGIPLEVLPENGTIEIVKLSSTINKMVTAITASRKSLKTHSEFLQNVIDNSPDLIFGMSAKGKMKFINPAGEKITGYTQEEIINKNWRHLIIFPKNAAQPREILQNFLKEGLNNYQVNLISKTGQIKNILLNTFEIKDETNQVLEILGFGNDITELKKAETEKGVLQKQLAHRNKMDSIGQLAGGIAHDFNNMLAGILGAAQLLESPKRKLDKKSMEFVRMITQSVDQAANLISKLLTFSRKVEIIATEIGIHKILDDVVGILKRTIDKKIQIIVDKTAQFDRIIGDTSALQNALMNLCINASHAMPEGGMLQISTHNLDLNSTYCHSSPFELTPGKFLEIEIRDHGKGIPEEYLEKIFEPFFTTKKQGEGTGLGLASVYGTIQELHGAITVYSELGEGSVFHLLFPCSDVLQENNQNIPDNIIYGSGHILIVDDEEILRITAKTMLEEMGYSVETAANGQQAVDVFKEKHNTIDLVIMEMIMPQMNGSEAYMKMKEIDKNCRVIIASGFTKNKNINELKKEGISGFIQKPFRNFELSRLVADIITKK